MITYPVNEIFNTIQGEATFTGTSATFIRLQGCPVGCGWCDTKHTWEVDTANAVSPIAIIEKRTESPTWSRMTTEEISKRVPPHIRHIVITGGEPCLYDLHEITRTLGVRRCVQIETSGTHEIKVALDTWVTVSPKMGMAGGYEVLDSALHRADEIKFVIGKSADLAKLRECLPHVREGVPIYLAPMSLNQTATDLCVRTAIEHNWKLSLQSHKYIGVR